MTGDTEKNMEKDTPRPEDEDVKLESNEGERIVRAKEIAHEERRIRQAVVVIHGIGEQRPMDTLRSFVDAVLPEPPLYGCKYRSKPDSMNELFETRCLQAPTDRQGRRPLTDFYEYYWAHHMKNSKYTQVLGWLKDLLLRQPGKIPPALRPVYFFSWGIVLFAFGLWLQGLFAARGGGTFIEGIWQQKWFFVSGLMALLAQSVGTKVVLGFVADAARYLTPNPENIEARNAIRTEGIKLLRALHASGKYRRIVVVGHSLGAVIGYDIIRNLWTDLRKPVCPKPKKQQEIKVYEQEVGKLEGEGKTSAKIEAFQQYQHRLWHELRSVGVPWLITDFVTLGAPLAHAQLLMSDNPQDLERKKTQYEYPCCPPFGKESPYYSQRYQIDQVGDSVIRNVFIPHHGAPFCCMRWTNLYFPYRRLIFGDLIGGPLNGIFGKGIRDIAVTPSTNNWLHRTLFSHIHYWSGSNKTNDALSYKKGKPALKALQGALRLDFLRSKIKSLPGEKEIEIRCPLQEGVK